MEGAEQAGRLGAEARLRERILEHLKQGPDSISGVARELSRGRDAPLHRLTVAGYLQALTDAGVLRELDRPPSKMYQLQNPEAHWSLHQRLHRLLADDKRPPAESLRLGLAALQTILQRPIFHAELVHAGWDVPADALEKVTVSDSLRRTYRDLVQRRTSPRIELLGRDPLYHLPASDPLLGSAVLQELLRRLVVRATAAEHLVAERVVADQRRLDLEG